MTAAGCRQHLEQLLELAELDLFDASIAQRPLDDLTATGHRVT
jgi:hypothetical protein